MNLLSGDFTDKGVLALKPRKIIDSFVFYVLTNAGNFPVVFGRPCKHVNRDRN